MKIVEVVNTFSEFKIKLQVDHLNKAPKSMLDSIGTIYKASDILEVKLVSENTGEEIFADYSIEFKPKEDIIELEIDFKEDQKAVQIMVTPVKFNLLPLISHIARLDQIYYPATVPLPPSTDLGMGADVIDGGDGGSSGSSGMGNRRLLQDSTTVHIPTFLTNVFLNRYT
jgi:hypothetical protein